MKSLKRIKIFNLIVVLFVVIFAVGYAFAWFVTDVLRKEMEFNGSSASAYFAGGNGTEAHPYQIQNRNHMYNLAWLQDTGRFTDMYGNPEKIYFELIADINMGNAGDELWLPPIGSANDPFVGVFDGNGHQILNLKITTDKNKLNANGDSPLQARPDYEFGNSVGLFGVTESISSSNRCEIKRFILTNPTVEVATSVQTKYSAVTETDPQVTGLAIGYVGGLASSIGVRGGTLIAQANYSTFNSILGTLGDGIESSVTGGGHAGGSGTGNTFGSSLDVVSIYERIELIGAIKYGIPVGTYTQGATLTLNEDAWRLPKLANDSKYWTIDSSERLPFTVTSESIYTGTEPQEYVSSNNVGYLTGNTNKFGYTMEIKFADRMYPNGSGNFTAPTANTVPAWFYEMNSYVDDFSGTYTTAYFDGISQDQYDALPDDVKDLIMNDGVKHKFFAPQLSQTYQYQPNALGQPGNTGGAFWTYYGEIDWNGGKYGEGENRDGYAATNEGYFYDSSGELIDENGYIFYKDLSPRQYIPDQYANPDFALPIYGVDASGYAKNAEGHYYDLNGGSLNEHGFTVGSDGGALLDRAYWLYGNIGSFNADGILCDGDGNYCYDAEGYVVTLYGGYHVDAGGNLVDKVLYVTDASGDIYYENGDPVYVVVAAWGNQRVQIHGKQGNKVKAKAGTKVGFNYLDSGVLLPNNAIWFKPAQPGMIRFVVFSTNKSSGSDGITLVKATRTSATRENPFAFNFTGQAADISYDIIIRETIPSYMLIYYEFEVTAADIAAGNQEYIIWNLNNGQGVYFLYLDIGANSEGDKADIDLTKQVSAVDFIYNGVSIKTTYNTGETIQAGNFVISDGTGGLTAYVASKTSLYFEELKGAFVIVFSRPDDGSDAGGHTISATVTRVDSSDPLGSTVSALSLITYT